MHQQDFYSHKGKQQHYFIMSSTPWGSQISSMTGVNTKHKKRCWILESTMKTVAVIKRNDNKHLIHSLQTKNLVLEIITNHWTFTPESQRFQKCGMSKWFITVWMFDGTIYPRHLWKWARQNPNKQVWQNYQNTEC